MTVRESGDSVSDSPTGVPAPALFAPLRIDGVAASGEGFFISNADEVLAALARHTGDCVKLLDLDGRVLRWNAACEDLYGWNAHEVIGKHLPHILEPQRLGWVQQLRTVAAESKVTEREAHAVRADGSRVTLHMVLIPVLDRDGDAAAVLSLTRELGEDTRLERHREDFVAVISRELRDPLTAVLGFTQLLQHPAIIDDPERRARTVRALTERAVHMSTLLDDLLVVFEFERGELVLSLEPVDPASAVTDAVSRVHGAESRVLVDFEPAIGSVPADRPRLVQAVTSLVDNALHHSPRNAFVGVSVYGTGGEVVIEVADTGPGIEIAEQSRIFDRFYSGASVDGGREGIGIGLFLARVVAEAHGGAITVASAPGAGSTFTLRLPRTATSLESEIPS